MATEKQIASRVVQKHDIEAHWNLATNFIPKQGEIVVYDIDDNYNYERFKIGDGVTNVNELPFANEDLDIRLTETEEKLDYLYGNYSEDLKYTLSDDGASYIVAGIGTCTETDIKIPPLYNGLPVTSIGNNAFYNCSRLTSITIPDSVTEIGFFAFRNCSSLTSVVIGDSVTSIGSNAFRSCSSLTSVKIGDNVTSICESAFSGCSSLTNVTIPNRITSIGSYAFNGCSSLVSVTIPDSVTSLGDFAFGSCTSLTSVTIPDSVESIGSYAFNGCPNLTINCEATEQPNGWSSSWKPNNRPVIWGTALDFIEVNYHLNDIKDQLNDTNGQLNDINDHLAELDSNLTAITEEFPNLIKMIPITYSELKFLRDNFQLIPGMFYRITDYVCTTSQENTRAMDNKFDIIVQALSSNTLSETASAAAGRGTPILSPSVLTNKVIKSLVVPYYREYLDYDGPGIEGLDPDYRQDKDIFVAYDYLENNEGATVPVIYKTDLDGIDPTKPYFNSEFEDPDFTDTFYYVGTAEVDGVIYDKWRLIDYDEDTESGDFAWDSDAQAYVYTNQIVQNNIIEVDSFLYEEESDEYTLDSSAVETYYFEIIDCEEANYELQQISDKKFAAYEYLPDNTGNIVPVLYDWVEGEGVGVNEQYYYVGKATINGEVYDKWRKIELDSDTLSWTSAGRAYYYTNVIVEDSGGSSSASNFSAWELKYCLDNDTTRFAWAGWQAITNLNSLCSNGVPLTRQPIFDGSGGSNEYYYAWGTQADVDDDDSVNFWYSKNSTITNGETLYAPHDGSLQTAEVIEGKGVIYYMKDEHGNECPYDFKNIQFKRDTAWQEEHRSFVEDSLYLSVGDVEWFYTFSWVNENLEVEDLTMKQDLVSDDGTAWGTRFNVMGKVEENGGITLPSNIIINSYQRDDGFFYGCRNNTFRNNCSTNTFGNDCSFNVFRNNCRNNTFGNSCDNNTFGNNCNHNTFGNGCSINTFENGCDNNTFGNNCNHNTFSSGCRNNIFGDMCGTNTFNGGTNNTFGNECIGNTFSRGCSSNVLGNNCNSNYFEDDCYKIIISGDSVSRIKICSGIQGTLFETLTIAPVANANYQQIYRKSGTQEIILD